MVISRQALICQEIGSERKTNFVLTHAYKMNELFLQTMLSLAYF